MGVNGLVCGGDGDDEAARDGALAHEEHAVRGGVRRQDLGGAVPADGRVVPGLPQVHARLRLRQPVRHRGRNPPPGKIFRCEKIFTSTLETSVFQILWCIVSSVF